MIGKILDWWLNRYYSKGVKYRSVMLVHGEKYGALVKVRGTKENLKLALYIAMIRNEEVQDIVLGASEWYRETGDDPMEYFKKLYELRNENNN